MGEHQEKSFAQTHIAISFHRHGYNLHLVIVVKVPQECDQHSFGAASEAQAPEVLALFIDFS